MPASSHLNSCTPTKSTVYPASSLTAAVSEPDLYSLLTFHVPNLTTKLEDYPLSTVRVCLFSIFAATLHIEGRSSIATMQAYSLLCTADAAGELVLRRACIASGVRFGYV